MLEKSQQNIIFILTKDDILVCARELGIAEEQVADETIELVRDKINR